MKRIFVVGLATLLAACSSSGGSAPAASAPPVGDSGTPADLKGLIGSRGSSGEGALKNAGYEFRNGSNTDTSSITHWLGKGGACVEVTTTDGRYASLIMVDAAKCADDMSAVSASGKPGAMPTVCGVIVDGTPHRYLCEVEENRQGTTVLRMPDTVLRLTWRLGSKSVEVAQEGATFFYISSPQMAALEVKHFKK